MRTYLNTLFVTVMLIALSSHAGAAVVEIGHYGLGESGTVTGSAATGYTPLTDDIGGHDLSISGTSSNTSIISSDPAVPDSTEALSKTGGVYWTTSGAGTTYGGITDNFAIDLWVRTDSGVGSYLLATDNSSSTSLVFWATSPSGYSAGKSLSGQTIPHGNSLLVRLGSGGVLGSIDTTYKTDGTWYRMTVVDSNNTLYYYLDGSLVDQLDISSYSFQINQLYLGAEYGGASGASASFDELSVYQFTGADSLTSVTDSIFSAASVPTPAALPAGLALLAFGAIHRRRA